MQYHLFEEPPPDRGELFQELTEAKHIFLKFLTANDLGLTGSHQDGIYLSLECWPLFLSEPGRAGENLERPVSIHPDNGPPFEACFKWYGREKNEYRLTRLRPLFRNQEEQLLGALFLFFARGDGYRACTIRREEEMELLLDFLGLSPVEACGLLRFDLEERLQEDFERYRAKTDGRFPGGEELAGEARRIFEKIFAPEKIDPDRDIIALINLEFSLFRFLEKGIYQPLLNRRYQTIEELMITALEISNRRKSRAGRSLEYHLRYIFDSLHLSYSHNEVTETGKRPDFIFPDIETYRNASTDSGRLFFLGAKTTCKDRWRQVMNEADRIQTKHIFTLQQGFTTTQLNEMEAANVIVVLPRQYHTACREEDRKRLMTLTEFIDGVLKVHGPAPAGVYGGEC